MTPRPSVTAVATTSATQPAAPPSPTTTPVPTLATGRVVFERFTGNAEGRYVGTYILAAGQTKPTQLTMSVSVEDALIPTWSVDGTRLLVNVATLNEPRRPGLVNADGASLEVLQPKGIDKEGLFCTGLSPDGSRVLCSLETDDRARDGMYELTTADAKLTRLTISPVHDTVGTEGECGGGEGRGVYSPDATMFAFIQQHCGTGPRPDSDEYGALVVAKSDGSHERTILEKGVRTHAGSQLSWSPDGTWIVFGTQSLELARIHPDGSGYELINLDVGAVSLGVLGPAWSPDGASIVFATIANGSLGSLYVVAADGSHPTLLPGTYGAAFPRWGPAQ